MIARIKTLPILKFKGQHSLAVSQDKGRVSSFVSSSYKQVETDQPTIFAWYGPCQHLKQLQILDLLVKFLTFWYL